MGWETRTITADVRVWVPDVVDPDPPQGTMPLIGASGLPWNHALTGSSPLRTKRSTWEQWLGHPVDGSESFPGRATWDTMSWVDPDFAHLPGYRVITLPAQPQGPNRDQGNQLGASGQYNWWWEQYGQKLTDLGMNHETTIIRLNHEPQPNAYSWHSWSWQFPGVETFVQAWGNAARSLRRTAPRVSFSICHSRGHFDTRLTGGRTWGQCTDLLMPLEDHNGKPLVTIVGQDTYDNSPGVTPNGVTGTEAQRLANWRMQTNGVNSDTPPGRSQGFGIPCRGTSYAFCEDWTARRGSPVYWWQHEWGPSHRNDANGGDDDPYYIEFMWQWLQERAVGNGGLALGESFFNHGGAPDTNKHDILNYSTGQITAHNAQAGKRFKELWGS